MDKGTCRWPGCVTAARTREFCATHYYRAHKVKDYDTPWLLWSDARQKQPTPCRWPNCDARAYGRGLCQMHYQRAWTLQDFDAPWRAWQDRACQGCGDRFGGRNREQRFCSEACSFEAWKAVNTERVRELARQHSARRRARMRGATAEEFTEADVRERSGEACYLCGESIDYSLRWPDPLSPSVDHIFPLSKGGTHTLDNVAMTHLACNNSKNATVLAAHELPTPTPP